jgi:hypothetical protein
MNSLNLLFAIIIGVTITILGGVKTYDYIHAHGFTGSSPIERRTIVITNDSESTFGTRVMRPSDTFRMDFIMAGYSLNNVDWFALNPQNITKVKQFPMYDINTIDENPFLVRAVVYFDCCIIFVCQCNVRIGPY